MADDRRVLGFHILDRAEDIEWFLLHPGKNHRLRFLRWEDEMSLSVSLTNNPFPWAYKLGDVPGVVSYVAWVQRGENWQDGDITYRLFGMGTEKIVPEESVSVLVHEESWADHMGIGARTVMEMFPELALFRYILPDELSPHQVGEIPDQGCVLFTSGVWYPGTVIDVNV